METININLIVKHKDAAGWENANVDCELPTLPRIGEHVSLTRDGQPNWYKVVAVIHYAPFKGMTEVFAVYDALVYDMQRRLTR
jgi:hypothetical protein